MSIPKRTWFALALVYALFFIWYTPFGGPLSDAEIEHYTEVLNKVSNSPERLKVWVGFMQSDTGGDFAMLNAIELREKPTPGPGIEAGDSSEAVLSKYTTPFLGLALRSAAHPVLMGKAAAPAIDLWGIEGAEHWSQGGLVRYRSRRDLMKQLEAISTSTDLGVHHFKIAAMEKTIAYPLDPWFQLGDPRLVLGLFFLVLGLGGQAILPRRN